MHYQNAYVTRDIEKWVDTFQQHAKVDRVVRYEGRSEMTTPDGPAWQTSKLAFLWVGNLQYEFIQPIEGSLGIYSDALPDDDSLRFHHICMRIRDWDDFRARAERQPYSIVMEGGTGLSFLYLDTRPLLGHYAEYTCMTDDIWAAMGGPLPQAGW